MKLKTTLIVTLFTLSSTMAFSADKKLNTDDKKASYTVGVQVAQMLMQQGITDLDPEVLAMAIDDVMAGKPLKMTDKEMQQAMVAYNQRLEQKKNKRAGEAVKRGDEYRKKNAGKKGVVTLKNGIQYEVIKPGSGRQPTATSTVVAHYEGTLIDGTVFDSSYKRGAPATFPLNRVIKGWQEVVPMMKIGAKWRVVIPSELAYGSRGSGASIGPNETLIFIIELIEIKN